MLPIDPYDAHRRLHGHVRQTPLLPSPWLSTVAGRAVYLKAESLQETGSFKARGALNRLLQLGADERARGVVTASAGNHGQGVAWAAARVGIRATIVLPVDAVAVKVARTRAWGAEVIQAGNGYDEAHAHAVRLAQEMGAIFVSGFEDPAVIAADGAIAIEVLDERPEIGLLVVPVGGGGLVSGIAIAASLHPARPRVLGMQSTLTPAMHEALRAGHLVPVDSPPTLADGLSGDTGETTFELCRAHGVTVELVPEESLLGAIGETLSREHLAIEGSAAVTVAAVLQGLIPPGDGAVALILSGGNADPKVLARALDLVD